MKEEGVIVDTNQVYEIKTFYGKYVGRPAEIKKNYLILDISEKCRSKTVSIPMGQIYTIKKIERCVHLREITTENKETILLCSCEDCEPFLEHLGDSHDSACSEFCKYRRLP